MLKKGNSPFWQRPQYRALTAGRWDIVTIMLGTNDAKDPGSHGPNNWQHDCGGPDGTTLDNCSYATDYHDMIELIKTLGTTSGKPPKIYAMIPPALMQQDAYGMNQTVINSVFPKLVPLIQQRDSDVVLKTIDIFSGMGGEPNWATDPNWPKSCAVGSEFQPCGWWCDAQSCDQCHPNDDGYAHMAQVLKAGLGL